MDHQKKLEFVHKMSKLALEHVTMPEAPQHLDSGGTVLGAPGSSTVNSSANPANNGIGGAVGSVLGTNDNFQAGSAAIQAGTNNGQLNNAYTGVQGALGDQGTLVGQTAPGTQQGLNAQSTLSNQYAQEAAGQGPNPAQAALNQSTGENIQQQAALAAGTRGAGANAGLIAQNNAQQGAATQQAAVGQAATLQAQQQLAAQSGLAGLSATQVGQGASAVQNENETQQNEQNILQNANTSYNNAGVGMQSNINNTNAQTAAANAAAAAQTVGGITSGLSSLFAHGGMVKMDTGGNVLDANARKHIAPENFALPGRRYPIHDENHARNALARVSQHGTSAEKAKVKAAVHKKYPSIGAKKMADGGDVESESSNGPNIPATPSLPSPPSNSSPITSLAALAPLLMANGGAVKGAIRLAGGGYIPPQVLAPAPVGQPQSAVGRFIANPVQTSAGPNIGLGVTLAQSDEDYGADYQSGRDIAAARNKGNPGPATPAPVASGTGSAENDELAAEDAAGGAETTAGGGTAYSDMEAASADATTQNRYKGGLMKSGGKVKAGKGQQAVKKGDSLENDKVPTMLSPGEIVLPRHITMSDRAPEKAAEFVRMTLAKRKK